MVTRRKVLAVLGSSVTAGCVTGRDDTYRTPEMHVVSADAVETDTPLPTDTPTPLPTEPPTETPHPPDADTATATSAYTPTDTQTPGERATPVPQQDPVDDPPIAMGRDVDAADAAINTAIRMYQVHDTESIFDPIEDQILKSSSGRLDLFHGDSPHDDRYVSKVWAWTDPDGDYADLRKLSLQEVKADVGPFLGYAIKYSMDLLEPYRPSQREPGQPQLSQQQYTVYGWDGGAIRTVLGPAEMDEAADIIEDYSRSEEIDRLTDLALDPDNFAYSDALYTPAQPVRGSAVA